VIADGYEESEHTADWALRVRGADLSALCTQAATGMLELAGAEPGPRSVAEERVDIRGRDAEEVLVRWLEEVLYRLEMESLVPTAYRLASDGKTQLTGTVDLAELARLEKAIKAVTFHGLRVAETEAGLETTIVFDV
jgi:SHS2 domain-containing protein